MSADFSRIDAKTTQAFLVCAAVGDALGWPQEVRGGLLGGKRARDRAEPALKFRSWVRSNGFQANRYRDPVGEGQYSDDTQLLLATARACLSGAHWWERFTEVELPTWPLYQRGGGGAVLRAASSWADGRAPWIGGTQKSDANRLKYLDAGANGVAMRIAPHVAWADSAEDLVARVVRDGTATHGHPRALVGALAYAFVLQNAASSVRTLEFGELVDAAFRGLVDPARAVQHLPDDWGDADAFAKAWDATNHEMATLLDQIASSLDQGALSPPTATLERIGCTDQKIYGAGTITAAGAIYLAARFASRPDGALLASAFLRDGDTDTLASMTAAVLGAVHGVEWLFPLSHTVQDLDYLLDVGGRTATREVKQVPKTVGRRSTARTRFRDAVVASSIENSAGLLDFPDGRDALVRRVEPLGDGKVYRAFIDLGDGQTVLVDLTGRAAQRLQTRLAGTKGNDRVGGNKTRDLSAQDQLTDSRSIRAETETLQPTSSDRDRKRSSQQQVRENADNVSDRVDSSVRAEVMLITNQLWRCAEFYAQLLGIELVVRNRSLRITSSLLLRSGDESEGVEARVPVPSSGDNVPGASANRNGRSPANAAEISLQLPDVRAAAARMSLPESARRGAHYVLTDPDGRTVWLRSR